MSTTECSWRLCPMPGMYAVTSMPVVSRTRATFRNAEFGFFGVVVDTRTQTPRRCGELRSAGDFDFLTAGLRPMRMSCWMVGIVLFFSQQASTGWKQAVSIPKAVAHMWTRHLIRHRTGATLQVSHRREML